MLGDFIPRQHRIHSMCIAFFSFFSLHCFVLQTYAFCDFEQNDGKDAARVVDRDTLNVFGTLLRVDANLAEKVRSEN